MDLNSANIRETCTDAVFERGRDYRDEGRIQRIERFGDVVTATVRGTSLYDVTVDLGGHTIDARCTCPYEGAGECKHVVAVMLDVVADPPQDESERVERVIEDISSNDLRAFVRDALAENPDLREQFLARFGDGGKSVGAYRDEIEELFDQHTQRYPVFTEAIDFSHFFEVAEQYRERKCYRTAAPFTRPVSGSTVRYCVRARSVRRSIRSLVSDRRRSWLLGTFQQPARVLAHPGTSPKQSAPRNGSVSTVFYNANDNKPDGFTQGQRLRDPRSYRSV